MIIIPAIDIKESVCVRLIQGDPDKKTVYNQSPSDQAKIWQDKGASLIHIVDLDGAFEGKPVNLAEIESIARLDGIDIELGGGLRSPEIIKQYLDIGVKRIILGTAAYKEPDIVSRLADMFPDMTLIVGIDVVDKMIAVGGWTKITDTHYLDFAAKMEKNGAKEFIITDIKKDGMLTGPTIPLYEEALRETSIPIIASGGVSNLDDIKNLMSIKNYDKLKGVITGKALYEKTLNFEDALSLVS